MIIPTYDTKIATLYACTTIITYTDIAKPAIVAATALLPTLTVISITFQANSSLLNVVVIISMILSPTLIL